MQDTKTPAAPWWKHGHVWLLIAGPAAVVIAGFATMAIAMKTEDPIVVPDYYRQGIEINKTLASQDKSRLPALQGRNHAATPSAP